MTCPWLLWPPMPEGWLLGLWMVGLVRRQAPLEGVDLASRRRFKGWQPFRTIDRPFPP